MSFCDLIVKQYLNVRIRFGSTRGIKYNNFISRIRNGSAGGINITMWLKGLEMYQLEGLK